METRKVRVVVEDVVINSNMVTIRAKFENGQEVFISFHEPVEGDFEFENNKKKFWLKQYILSEARKKGGGTITEKIFFSLFIWL